MHTLSAMRRASARAPAPTERIRKYAHQERVNMLWVGLLMIEEVLKAEGNKVGGGWTLV